MSMNPVSAAKNFAHLITGRGTVEAKKAKEVDNNEEDDKDKAEDEKNPPADDKEDGKKGKKAGKKCDDDEDTSEGMSAEDKGSEEKEEEKEEEEDDDKDKKGRKAKKKASAAGFDEETLARCSAIFGSEHAAGRADIAANLAFNTQLSAEAAISVMEHLPPVAKGRKLDEKMATVKVPNIGAGDGKAGPSAHPINQLVASMLGAYEKATS